MVAIDMCACRQNPFRTASLVRFIHCIRIKYANSIVI